MNNDSFQNKRKDMVTKRQFDQLSSLLSSSLYQVASINRFRYSSLIISISMLFLFIGVSFVDSIVFKIVIFVIFTLIAAPLTALIINIDRTVFTIKDLAKNEHINKIQASKKFYEEVDPFEDNDDVRMLIGKDDYSLLKFMDTYVEEKSDELSDSVENVFSDFVLSWTKIPNIKNNDSQENINEKKVQELETLISEYEDTIDIFNHCRMSIVMIHVIEHISDMNIEDFKQKIDGVFSESEIDKMKKTGFFVGDTMILSDDIQDMINDKETVRFMMEIYSEDFTIN